MQNTTPTSSTAILLKLGLLFLARTLCHQDAPKTSRLKPLHLLSCNLFEQGGRSSKHTKTCSTVAAPHRGHLDLHASHNLPGNKSRHAEPTSIHPKFVSATRMPTKARTTWQDAASNNRAQHVRAVGALLPEVPVKSCHHTCRRVIPQSTASVEESLCRKVQRLTHVFSHLSCRHQHMRPSRAALRILVVLARAFFVSMPTTQRNPIHGVTPRRSSKREDLHAWARHHPCIYPLIVAQGIRVLVTGHGASLGRSVKPPDSVRVQM